PRLVRLGGGDAAGLAVPPSPAGGRRPGTHVAVLPPRAGHDLRQRRLLGNRPRRRRRAPRPAQPGHRGQGPRARGAQVALLGGLRRARRLRPPLRRRQPRRGEAGVRPGQSADPAVRESGDDQVSTMRIADALASVMPEGLPVRLTAYDGSAAGPEDAPMGIHLRTERGLRYLLTAPGDLGMARAFVAGDLHGSGFHPGNLYPLLILMDSQDRWRRPSPAEALQLVRGLGWEHLNPPPPPPQES